MSEGVSVVLCVCVCVCVGVLPPPFFGLTCLAVTCYRKFFFFSSRHLCLVACACPEVALRLKAREPL